MSSKSTVDLFNGLLAGLKENDKLKAQYNLQPPVMAQQQVPQVQIPMAQQQVPQVQIPMAPPVPQQVIPTGQVPPTVTPLPDPNFLDSMPQGPSKPSQVASVKETQDGFSPSELPRFQSADPFNLTSQAVDAKETQDGFSPLDLLRGRPVGYQQGANLDSIPEDIDVGSLKAQHEAEEKADREALVTGDLTIFDYKVNKERRGRELSTGENKKKSFDQGNINRLTVRANKLEKIGLTEEANQVRAQIPKPEGSEIPKAEQELLDGGPAVGLTPTQPVVPTTQPVATPTQPVVPTTQPAVTPTQTVGGVGTITPQDLTVAGDALDPTLKKKIDTAIKKATGDEILEEEDEEGKKEGFLKNLWGGVKGFFKEGFEDPMLRKTLLAYVLSKAVGADGVTAAGMVLEAEYKKDLAKTAREAEAAEKQLDREYDLLQTMSKEQRAAYKKQIEDNTIDYTKSSTLYDNRTNKNYTGSVSPSGLIVIDDPSFYQGATMPDPNDPTKSIPIPAGTPLSIAALRQSGNFTVGEGKTSTELNTEMTGRMTEYFETGVAQRLAEATASGADSTAVATLEDLIRTKATPQNLSEAAMVYRSFYPTGTDFSSTEAQTIFNNGFDKWMTSITEGREGNAKSLAAFLEREHIKYNDQNRLSESFFEVGGEPIGAESWIKTSGRVKNLHGYLNRGRAGTNSEVTKPAVWNFLERAYLKQADQMGDEFKSFWEAQSEKSTKNKAQVASPAMLWIQSIGRKKATTGSKYFAGSMQDIIANMKD